IEYHSHTSLKATSDEIPWCSSFMCAAFEEVGIPSTRSAAARSWVGWGVKLEKPKEGCVVIFTRDNDLASGHVGIYVGETLTHIRCLGGNQKDAITVSDYPKSSVLG